LTRFIEYELIAQHVEQWQIVGQVLQSRSDLSSFCLEVMKQMDMRYMSPSMPVNVTLESSLSKSKSSESKNNKTKYETTVDDDLSDDGRETQVPTFKALTKLFEPSIAVSPSRNTTFPP
jgi:hypothetical protein